MNEDQAKAIGGTMQFLGIVFLIAVFAVGGTSRTQVDFVAPDVPAGSNSVAFEETLTAKHWLGGLIKGSQPDLSSALAKHMRDGEQVSRLSVCTRTTGGNMLATGFTLGIYCPQTVVVRGEVLHDANSPRMKQTASR
jgi:hypothetical protein